MSKVRLLNDLERGEKLAFFQQCQDLLAKNQPNSEFLLAEDNPKNNYFLDLFLRYKGWCYHSPKVTLLFNKRRYKNMPEAQDHYWDEMWDAPDENPNCYTIDFVTSKFNKALIDEIDEMIETESVFDDKLPYVCFIRARRVSFFKYEDVKKSFAEKFVK